MRRYIVVDDDSINNLICQLNIEKFEPTAEIKLFTEPEEALSYIRNEKNFVDSIILLDIDMPTMNGWQFLAEFSFFDTKIKINYSVFILSSAIEDSSDKIESCPDIRGFFSKPLSQIYLEEIKRISSICRTQ